LTVPEKNILYVGIDNYIEITGIDIDSTYNLTTIFSKSHKGSNKNFIVRAQRSEITDTLKLFKNEKLIFSKVYNIKRMPDQYAQLGNIKDTVATLKEILSYPTLEIVNPVGGFFRIMVHVISFEIQFISNNPQINSEKIYCEGNTIPKKQRKVIKKLNTGDKIIFPGIWAAGGSFETRKLQPISITIK